MLAAALIACLALLSQKPSTAVGTAAPCGGKHVYPNDNLALVADNSSPGTTFCIHDGLHETNSPIVVQDNDKFIGVYSDGSRPTVRGTEVEEIFEAYSSDRATIRGLRITGAVGDDACEPMCGRGIGGGADLTVANVRLDNNENQGIGGTGPGLMVRKATIEDNGSSSFANDGGPVSAAGIKSTKSMTILNSHIRDNYWNGVWCDMGCGAFEIRNSIIENNGKAGIHDEISSGPAVFEDNVIRNNGILPEADQHAGLLIVSSTNVTVSGNRFKGNVDHGVEIIDDKRAPDVGNVSIFGNILINDIYRCSMGGVSCSGNEHRSRGSTHPSN